MHVPSNPQQPKKSLQTFLVMWFGQTISSVGSGLTIFALMWWVWITYKQGIALAGYELAVSFIPVFLGPFAGAYVDKWDRRMIMLVADIINGIVSLCIVFFIWNDLLNLGWVMLFGALSSIVLTFHGPAFEASIPQLIDEKNLGRANGMQQFALGLSLIFAPVIGGILLGFGLSVGDIIVIDTVSFWVAAISLLFIRIPSYKTEEDDSSSPVNTPSFLKQVGFGFSYIWNHKPLLALLGFIAALNLVWNPYSILLPQIVTEKFNAGPELLGGIDGAIGGAFLVGSIFMSIWGGPKRRVLGAVGVMTMIGLGAAIAGFGPNASLVAIGMGFAAFMFPIQNGSSQAIWQSHVPPQAMGRVLAVRRSIALCTKPISVIVAGLLAPAVISADTLLGVYGLIAIGIGILGLMFPLVHSLDKPKHVPENDIEVLVPEA